MKKALSMALSAVIGGVSVLPVGASAAEAPHKFTASFTPTARFCQEWDEERWEKEFADAKNAGFDSLILQSSMDYIRESCQGNEQNPADYEYTAKYCLFPTKAEADKLPTVNDGDGLELALKAAKANDMQLWLGLVCDDIWWQYCYGEPTSYFTEWSGDNAELCSELVTEMWERYGEKYGDQIAGWYYNNEIWNIKNACDGSNGDEFVCTIGDNLKATVDAINESCPEKPLMMSPFYTENGITPEQFTSFFSDVIGTAEVRPYDICAMQDGGNYSYSPEVVREWAEALKTTVNGRMRFWMNNICYVMDFTYMRSDKIDIDDLRASYLATADLAEENVILSWNFHFAPDEERMKQFADFLSERTAGDVNLDGKLTVADIVSVQRWLLGAPDASLRDWRAADFCEDGRLDMFDLCLMRSALVKAEKEQNAIIVKNINELRKAVKNAKAGDVIKVAGGLYDCSDGKILAEADGTAEAPITLEALDPSAPPLLIARDTARGYILHITGDWWVIDGIDCNYVQKGIVLDNSNHTVIQNCEIFETGAEAVAIRDGSSYCTVKNCNIHDTGLVSPGYGEGVYIGSSKEKTEFDFKCDHNKVIGCTFKNVAAEHVDVKEYTTDTEISGCTFYGDGMSGENYAGSFLDLKGNDCYVHDNVGYRNKNPKIVAAFEVHEQVEGWGYHHVFENNTLYLDQPYGEVDNSRRIYVVDGWFSDFSVKGNKVDYGEGLVPADSAEFYKCEHVTFLN